MLRKNTMDALKLTTFAENVFIMDATFWKFTSGTETTCWEATCFWIMEWVYGMEIMFLQMAGLTALQLQIQNVTYCRMISEERSCMWL